MLDKIIDDRKKKIAILKENGIDPYPARSKKSLGVSFVLDNFLKLLKSKKSIGISGRVKSVRDQGKILFVDLEDLSGKIQVIFHRNIIKDFSIFKSTLESGDFVWIYGKVLKTQRGEKSIEVKNVQFLTKALRPIPTEYFGIEDIETKLRKRYLDLILNKETRDLFIKKSKFWASIREYLNQNNFMEVETAVLENTPGGAEAEPFTTHHNALNEDFYLRISLEIALKKLMVGGFEKIYEIGRIFRNEGIDAEHLQDYTQLEFYWAYADYNELMKFVQKMYQFVIKKTFGTLVINNKGKKINWGGKWKTIDYCKIFSKNNNNLNPITATKEQLYKRAKELKLDIDDSFEKGRLIDLIFKKIRPTLIQPCFLINPPVDIEPLAKRNFKKPEIVERFQVVACGTELGKGFSEANDPVDQRQRFENQMKLREKGDKEAQMLDEDFIEALEYGMPPTAGFGLSERLFAILADKSIRETVFFPPMKKKD